MQAIDLQRPAFQTSRVDVTGNLGGRGGSATLQTALSSAASRDPWTIAGASAVLTLAMAAACLVPAQRAARRDPVAALRVE